MNFNKQTGSRTRGRIFYPDVCVDKHTQLDDPAVKQTMFY